MSTNLYDNAGNALETAEGLVTLAKGATVPVDATGGYAVGCIFQKTDGTSGTTLYINQGSSTSSAFSALGGRNVTDSALVGATVVLKASQSGQTFNNRATSGSPSWTLPTAANGLWFTFTVSNVTAGFTVTGGTIKAKASATGVAISGTTLTNTQGTAVVGDTITLVCDGTVWRMVSQSGIFAAA